MSFIKWHKKQVEKNLNMFGLSNYQGLWVSFIKGLIFGAIIMWFVSCNEQVVVKKAPTTETKTTSELQSDYSIGVKGNCGMCKSTIEKAVKGMLPRGPLGREMYRKLKVYGGADHPHAAQQPSIVSV